MTFSRFLYHVQHTLDDTIWWREQKRISLNFDKEKSANLKSENLQEASKICKFTFHG